MEPFMVLWISQIGIGIQESAVLLLLTLILRFLLTWALCLDIGNLSKKTGICMYVYMSKWINVQFYLCKLQISNANSS